MKVVDNREGTGYLWVVGERAEIRNIVDEAVELFKISGLYATSKEIKNKRGWCTKSKK